MIGYLNISPDLIDGGYGEHRRLCQKSSSVRCDTYQQKMLQYTQCQFPSTLAEPLPSSTIKELLAIASGAGKVHPGPRL